MAGASSRSASEICWVKRNTAILYFLKLRELVAEKLVADAPYFMAREIEVDEDCFGGVRNAKNGRVAAGKIPVYRLFKRGERVYTLTIPNARSEILIKS